MTTKPEYIKLADIRLDVAAQVREKLDDGAVNDYAADMLKDPTQFEPVGIVKVGRLNYLWDGRHRVEAAKRAKLLAIAAFVTLGTREDAEVLAAGANAVHGIRRSMEDKRLAVALFLKNPERAKLSNREVARKCRVSDPFVSKLRAMQTANVSTPPRQRSVNATPLGKGKSPKPKPEESPSEPLTPCPPPLPQPEANNTPPAQGAPSLVPSVAPREMDRLKAEFAELQDRHQETIRLLAECQADNDSMARVIDAGGGLKAMLAENMRLREENRVLVSRNNGLMVSVNEHIRAIKKWQGWAKVLEKKIKEHGIEIRSPKWQTGLEPKVSR